MAKLSNLAQTKVGTVFSEKEFTPVTTKMEPVKRSLKITSHTDGQDVAGVIQIMGTGEPGKTVTVNIYAYQEVTEKKKQGLWGFFKNVVLPYGTFDIINEVILRNIPTSEVKESFYKSFTAKIDSNGKWFIPVFTSFPNDLDWINKYYKKYYVFPFAWLVSASSAYDPNYEKIEKNQANVRLGVEGMEH